MTAPTILGELTRVKALFQLRTTTAIIRGPHPHPKHDQSESDHGTDWLSFGGGADFINHDTGDAR